MPSWPARRPPTSTTYFQAANADAATRIKLFRLAFDAAVSSFSGRQQLYERYYSGDPVRLAGTLYGLYDKDTHIDRIVAMLDDLEARQQTAAGLADRAPPRGAGAVLPRKRLSSAAAKSIPRHVEPQRSPSVISRTVTPKSPRPRRR